MDQAKLLNLTIQDARKLLDSGDITSVELTKHYLKVIKDKNSVINAYITISEEFALNQARLSDERIAKGERGSLLGIPYAIKDSFSTKGIQTTAGSKMLDRYISPYNATVVERLENVGAILLGKTNMDAWGHGSSTVNSDFGVTKNPNDLSKVSGGSSGGSAAAVVADMCVFAIGEDTGGSIRQPAGFCGIYGLKVTYGKVPRYGCIAYASSLDTIGPMTKSPEDLEIVLKEIKGTDDHDATVQNIESKKEKANLIKTNNNSKPLNGIKFALPKEYIIDGMDTEVKTSLENLVIKIKEKGGIVEDVSIPSTKYCIPTYYIIAFAETSTNLARYDGIRFGKHSETNKGWMEDVIATRTENFSPEAKRRIMLGTYVLSSGYYDAYYIKAQKVRAKLIQEFDKVYENYDVILSPISPTPAFTIGENILDPLKMYLEDVFTVTINLVGTPSLAIPSSKSLNNLPIGMQLMGPKWSEDMLIEISKHLK